MVNEGITSDSIQKSIQNWIVKEIHEEEDEMSIESPTTSREGKHPDPRLSDWGDGFQIGRLTGRGENVPY